LKDNMKYVRILILIVLAMHAISVHCQSVSNVRKKYESHEPIYLQL
jgi:hypothetical protein